MIVNPYLRELARDKTEITTNMVKEAERMQNDDILVWIQIIKDITLKSNPYGSCIGPAMGAVVGYWPHFSIQPILKTIERYYHWKINANNAIFNAAYAIYRLTTII